MKKILLTSLTLVVCAAANAQVVTDTVATGTAYANQVWYSLENDNQGTAPKNNWDLAFDVSAFGTSIHANTVIGTKIWTYPLGDTSAWSTVDISDIANWPQQYNSETTWTMGALDAGIDPSNPFDLGWGIYNINTHIVSGDSIFVVQLANGDYKKLVINNIVGGAYNFTYADINGMNEQVQSLVKSDYTGKNFGYFSLSANAALDREPVSANWDLLFTQYTGFIPSPYTVTGVLANNGVSIAEVSGVADPATFADYASQNFETEINVIGYDWKSFNGSAYDVAGDLVYFISTASGDIWKIVFTGFKGSSTGEFIFTKEKMSGVGIVEPEKANFNFVTYPNPAMNGNTTIAYTLNHTAESGSMEIYALSGELVNTQTLNTNSGIHTQPVTTSTFNNGVYIIKLTFDGVTTQQRLIVQ